MGLIDVAIHPHLLLRFRVRWRRRPLMRSLAGGADPSCDERLLLLASTLTRRRERCHIARGIERVVSSADDPHLYWTSAAPCDTGQVLDARKELLELARRLRSDEPVNPCGVARAELLLTDYASPLQGTIRALTVREAANRAISALG